MQELHNFRRRSFIEYMILEIEDVISEYLIVFLQT